MNLKELYEIIKHYLEIGDYEDATVLLTLNERSIGSRASTNVSYAGIGMDWEHNQFRLEPESKICRLGNTFQDAMLPRERIYDGRTYRSCKRCEERVGKEDNFCKRCGQKLR